MYVLVAALAALLLVGLLSRRRPFAPRSSLARPYPPEVLADARALAVELGALFTAVEAELRAGLTTKQVSARVRDLLDERGLRPSFLGYHGYQDVCITSINEVANNGVPSELVINGGDLLKLEIGLRGAHSFATQAWTYPIGPLADEDRRLMIAARGALEDAVAAARMPNARTGDIGGAIQRAVEEAGFSVSRHFVGFAIGGNPHDDPALPCFGSPGRGIRLGRLRDRALCIYVIAHAGSYELTTDPDGWTTRTRDGKKAVVFSRTLAITDDGAEVLSPPRPEIPGSSAANPT
jgi:methionyl aminopeptidase